MSVAADVEKIAIDHGFSFSDHSVINIERNGEIVAIVFIRIKRIKVHSTYRNTNPEFENQLVELGFTVESF